MTQSLWRDTKYALRAMRRSPVFTLTAAATLALGIGASAALYSFVDAFILRPLPFDRPEQLVHLWSTEQVRGDAMLRSSLPDFRDWKAQSRSFDDMALFNYTVANLKQLDEPERVSIGVGSANMFELLGREPVLGRGFLPGEDAPGSPRVVVLSHAFWTSRYQGDPEVLGRTLELDERKHEIVGVMPADFAFPLNTTLLWRPYVLDAARYTRDYRSFQVVGRLRGDVGRSEAQAELDAIALRIEKDFPDSNENRGVNVVPLRRALNFAAEILDPMAALLTAAVGLVLIITCANIASLLLSRAIPRERELAIRSALGASRGRVLRQLLTESAFLGLGGAALGLPTAHAVLRWMDATIPPDLYRVGSLELAAGGTLVAIAVSLLAALGFGALPALQATRANPVASLKEGGRSAGSSLRHSRTHSSLAVAQVGTAFVLLICAALVTRSLASMKDVPLGFDLRVVTAQLWLTTDRYETEEAKRDFQKRLLAELAHGPGVEASSIVNFLPLNHETSMRSYRPADGAASGDGPPPRAISVVTAPGYFETMGITMLRGRDFSDSDDAAAPPAVIVNQALAEATWPGQPAVGRELRLGEGTDETIATVLGVVANTRHMRLTDPPERILYLPQYQQPWSYMRVLMRSGQQGRGAETLVRQAVKRVDATLPVSGVRTMAHVAREFLIPQRMLANALVVLGAAALLLAIVGIYGVLAQHVAGRTQEIGVRMALGASRGSVLSLILKRGAKLAALGAIIGIAGAFGTARLLESFMFGLSTTDVFTFASVALALGGTALIACTVPAYRAARVDPLEALRDE